MIDEEVETVLREIRERIRSQPAAASPSNLNAPGVNGNGQSQLIAASETAARSSESMARLNAHLTTTARAWDRLPPVFSNRRGTAARIEIWLKARLKTFSRWFTWEQVNFNAAVHHALGETLKTLTEQDAAITALQSENEALRTEIQTQRDSLESEIHSLRTQLQVDLGATRNEIQNQQRDNNALRAEIRGELEAVRFRSEDQSVELRKQIEARLREISEGLGDVENEQRVLFNQMSLEINETAVSSNRAVERTRVLQDQMEQRLKQLEDSKNS